MEGRSTKALEELMIGAPSIAAGAVGNLDCFEGFTLCPGTRIRMTSLGATRNPHFAEKEGTVVGNSRLNRSVRVLFDGRKTAISLHRDYIEPSALKEG